MDEEEVSTTTSGLVRLAIHQSDEEVIPWRPADDAKDRGPKVKLLGRWHDLQRFTGIAICESDDAQAVAAWALNWNGVLDVEAVPILDDDEARAVAKQKFG